MSLGLVENLITSKLQTYALTASRLQDTHSFICSSIRHASRQALAQARLLFLASLVASSLPS